MPNPINMQSGRQDLIRELLGGGPVATQQSLVEQLLARGVEATQSSVSRDLKDIGAIKTSKGYELPAAAGDGQSEIAEVADLLRDIAPAGPHLLVIRTAIGGAQQVALALDRCGWREIIGNIGGDDTVFTATRGVAAQRRLIGKIERAARP